MKARGVTKRRVAARANAVAGVPPRDEVAWTVVCGWWIIALLPVGLVCLMNFVVASDFKKSRLINPVATVGEFLQAECQTYRKASSLRDPHYMRVTYGFKAPESHLYDAAGAPLERHAQPLRLFTVIKDISYRSWAECEAALPVMRAAKASHAVLYELSNPDAASTSLDGPDSTGFLWAGLATIPLAIYAWLLGVLRQRQRQVGLNQVSETSAASAPDRLRYALRFVKFTQTPIIKKTFVVLFFLFWIGGFVGQFFWLLDNERAGKERVRAAAALAGR